MPHTRLLLGGLLLIGACASEVNINQVEQGMTIIARVLEPGMSILAAPKTTADVDHYRFKLYDYGPDTVAKNGDDVQKALGASTNTATSFTTVPDGNYYLKAEAWGDAGETVTLTQGGIQNSSNTVTVASPSVTYSVGVALTVTLDLLDGTGETVANSLTVNDGAAWTGAIGFTP